ncbi:MAG: polyprenyl synthetase family protein, partial [Phycisphaerales bacterium JB040]
MGSTREDTRAWEGDTGSIVRAVDASLEGYLNGLGLARELDGAVRYALLGGGKRMRPVLAWLSAEAVGGRGEASLPAGCAIELVHAFSLVHDDLPAMDDDDLRRGRPTLHRHAGEAMAILAGDAMLALAFGVLEGIGDVGLRARVQAELIAGTVGMINGQVYDTVGGFEASLGAEDRLRLIHRNKTGALIRAACRAGGRLGGADASSLEALTRFGEIVGLQFQVLDDLLDATGTSEEVGKRTGKDAAAGKLTYPGVLGVERTRAIARELHAEALG